MGCNCKGGKAQVINNLQSEDHILMAREIKERIIDQKAPGMFDEIETREVIGAFHSLYPNAKITPTIENAIHNINHAIQNYRKR